MYYIPLHLGILKNNAKKCTFQMNTAKPLLVMPRFCTMSTQKNDWHEHLIFAIPGAELSLSKTESLVPKLKLVAITSSWVPLRVPSDKSNPPISPDEGLFFQWHTCADDMLPFRSFPNKETHHRYTKTTRNPHMQGQKTITAERKRLAIETPHCRGNFHE